MDVHDAVVLVVFSFEQGLDPQGFGVGLHPLVHGFDFGDHAFVLCLFSQPDHGFYVFQFLLQVPIFLDPVFKGLFFFQQLLGAFVVVPKILGFGPCVDIGEFLFQGSRVKESLPPL